MMERKVTDLAAQRAEGNERSRPSWPRRHGVPPLPLSPLPPTSSRATWRGFALLALTVGCSASVDDSEFGQDAVRDEPVFELAGGVLLTADDLPIEGEPERAAADEQETDLDDPTAAPDQLADHERDPVQIAEETPSAYLGVRRVTDYYLNPLYAETSYASPDIPGCSATMIGPNILATAAHCGADGVLTMTAEGRVYRERDLMQPETAGYECNLLFHTFPETDLAIYHCPPPAFGLSLGDRFGWVDVSLVEPSEFSYVFSVFSNPIGDEGVGAASLLTDGYVSETNITNHWANPNTPHGVNSTTQLHHVMESQLWSNPGASGSGHFNSTGEMTIGPLSTGTADGLGRRALTMRDYMFYGWIYETQSASCNDPTDPDNCNTDNTVNGAYVSGLGLDPDDYRGTYADLDLDWFFDVVADIEDLEGENYKTLHHQSFGSRRQTRQWTMGPGSTHELNAKRVSYTTNTAGLVNSWVEIARHPNLNLSANQDYEVTFDLDSTTGYYRVCLDGNSWACSPFFFDSSADGQTAHRVSLVAPAGDPELVIQAWNGVGSLHDVSVTTSLIYSLVYLPPQGLTGLYHFLNDFDGFDAREAWGNPDGPIRPIIVPDGDDAGVDWAARISTASSGSPGFDYDLETTTLPFPEDGDGTLCFQHRRDDSAPWQGATLGRVRVERTDGSYVDGSYFIPTASWDETCIAVEDPIDSGEALRVKFGLYTTGAGVRQGTYFVDDVAVRLPAD